jgi:hypothetical protein
MEKLKYVNALYVQDVRSAEATGNYNAHVFSVPFCMRPSQNQEFLA